MKRTLLILTLVTFSLITSAQSPGSSDGTIVDPAVYPVDEEAPPTATQQGDVFQYVEEMPSWKGCETEENRNEIDICSQKKFLQYVKENLRYPEMAKDANVTGTVYLKCVIEKDGSITGVKIMRGVIPALDKEAKRLVEEMPAWNPGRQRGKIVRVQYVLPIHFKLDQ